MFLDKTYFQGDLYLPNLGIKDCTASNDGANPSGVELMIQSVGENTLDWFVEKYEREFLVRLLGKPLYDAFVAGMKEESQDDRWMKLKDVIYEKSGSFSFSPAANYVFYWISRRGRTQTSINGEVRGEEDHVKIAWDADKLVKAWNDMLPMIDVVYDFIENNRADYEDYLADFDCVCRRFKPINSLNI